MKTLLTVSVDVEPLVEARRRKVNLSGFVNGCLYSLVDMKAEKDPEGYENVNIELASARARVDALVKLEKKARKVENERRKFRVYSQSEGRQ